MRQRIEEELELLRNNYQDVAHQELGTDDWFHILSYPVPSGWRIGSDEVTCVAVAFAVTAGHPGAPPYGFLVSNGINFNGVTPNNGGVPPKAPPFPGSWFHFSWSPDNWIPAGDITAGSNLHAWARSFARRFKEGV